MANRNTQKQAQEVAEQEEVPSLLQCCTSAEDGRMAMVSVVG